MQRVGFGVGLAAVLAMGNGAIEGEALAQASEQLVFNDEFQDNRNNWALGDDEKRSLTIANGKYLFEHKRETGPWLTWAKARIPDDANFYIEASLKKVRGIVNHGYGLIFGALNADNKFAFVVSGDGHYRFGTTEEGKFRDVTGWVKSPQIRQGNGVVNLLAVRRQGDRYLLYINGVNVDSTKAYDFMGPNVGFELNNAQTVEIEYLRVSVSGASGALAVVAPPPPPPFAPPPPPPVLAPVVAPVPQRSGSPTIIAVFELEDVSKKIDGATLSQLTDYLSALLAKGGAYAIVPQSQIRDRLKEAKASSYRECYDSSCQIELGKAVAAEGILTTKVLRVGNECAVTSMLYDLKKETLSRAATVDTACGVSALMGAMRDVAKQL